MFHKHIYKGTAAVLSALVKFGGGGGIITLTLAKFHEKHTAIVYSLSVLKICPTPNET
jgi:hypothetical protein